MEKVQVVVLSSVNVGCVVRHCMLVCMMFWIDGASKDVMKDDTDALDDGVGAVAGMADGTWLTDCCVLYWLGMLVLLVPGVDALQACWSSWIFLRCAKVSLPHSSGA